MANSEQSESIMSSAKVTSALVALGCPVNKAAYLQAIEYIKSLHLKDIEVLHEQIPDPFNLSVICPNCSSYRWDFCKTCITNSNIHQTLGMIIDSFYNSQPTTNDASG